MQPNLLFIYTDEQAFNTLTAYGNSQIHMPHLNRLAEESIVFDQAYVTQPVCTPSRSTLLTGLYPHTSGCIENNVPLGIDIPCLPEMVKEGNYATAHYGKWHLGDEVFVQHGFDDWCSIEDGYERYYNTNRDPNQLSSYHHFLIENGFSPQNGKTFNRGEATRLPEEYGKPAFLAQESSRFIRENRDQPFILYVNFLEPHMPFFGPRDDQYDITDVSLPANFDDLPTEAQPLKARLLQRHYYEHGHSGLELKTESHWRRMIANYWGLCSLVDTHVGTILDTLEECGLRENTIVVFTSDHGDMMGSHRLLAKCVMFEEAVRVPLLIRLPGLSAGKRVSGPVSQIDVVPTLLDLMEQPIPDHLQGKSLKPQLLEEGDSRCQDAVFIEWNGPNNGLGDTTGRVQVPDWMAEMAAPEEINAAFRDSVRTIITPEGWKFNLSPLGEHELYNLAEDPQETENLAPNPEYASLMEQLTEQIREWQAETGDS